MGEVEGVVITDEPLEEEPREQGEGTVEAGTVTEDFLWASREARTEGCGEVRRRAESGERVHMDVLEGESSGPLSSASSTALAFGMTVTTHLQGKHKLPAFSTSAEGGVCSPPLKWRDFVGTSEGQKDGRKTRRE